ncbi:hypothetical protein PISMIDRAFT_92599, partial [Pisolithus microcarpus 441]
LRLDLGHVFMGEYYSSFGPNEDTAYPWGERLQTCDHIPTRCPLLGNKRHIYALRRMALF